MRWLVAVIPPEGDPAVVAGGRPFENPSVYDVYRFDRLTRVESQVLPRYLAPSDRVLDVGCGIGRVSYQIAGSVKEVVGLDISETAVRRAADRKSRSGPSNVSFWVADISNLTLELGRFDKVLIPYNSIEAIHPRARRRMALGNIRRLLTDSGRLLFSIHNRFYVSRLYWVLAQKLGIGQGGAGTASAPGDALEWPSLMIPTPDSSEEYPVYFYSLGTAKEDLRAAGFRLLESIAIEDENPTVPAGLNRGRSGHRFGPLIPGYYLVCAKTQGTRG